uniref:Uncharacterized protein n=1 Tax=Panagrellus redivivus TaxID=6233 RepID=A0A7E4ZVI5_PANRE
MGLGSSLTGFSSAGTSDSADGVASAAAAAASSAFCFSLQQILQVTQVCSSCSPKSSWDLTGQAAKMASSDIFLKNGKEIKVGNKQEKRDRTKTTSRGGVFQANFENRST